MIMRTAQILMWPCHAYIEQNAYGFVVFSGWKNLHLNYFLPNKVWGSKLKLPTKLLENIMTGVIEVFLPPDIHLLGLSVPLT